MSRENPVCPHCSNPLIYRDSRLRIWKWYGGVKRHIRIRRLRCTSCQRYHVELPDVLVPNKHYGSEVIENVVDDVSTPDDSSQLYLSMTNLCADKKRKKLNGRFSSTKGNGRGLGLIRVDQVIERMGGYLSRNSEDGAFTTEVLLPQRNEMHCEIKRNTL